MTQRKSLTTPFWILLVIVLLHLLAILLLVINADEIANEDWKKVAYLFMHGVLIGTECFLYWRFRRWIERRMLAHCHILGLLFAWIAVPFIFRLLEPGFDRQIANPEIYVSQMNRLYYVREGLTLAIQLLAHALFVWLMIDTIKKRKIALHKAAQTATTSPDLLHDYADQP